MNSQTSNTIPSAVPRQSTLINSATGELTETWKPLPLYDLERFYEVSNAGRVRCLANGSLVKTICSKEGEFFSLYHPVTFKYTGVQIHRAVALAFVPNPNGYCWVKRKDGNKNHNPAANLEWVASPAQRVKLAQKAKRPYSEILLDQLQSEGRMTSAQRQRAGIFPAQDDSMAPQLNEGGRFVAVPVSPVDYSSLVGKVVAVVVKAKLFAYYLGRVVSIDDESVRVSRDNKDWTDRTESRLVIASIAKVVSVLETTVN